jgi:hypothetical protein
MYRLLFAAAAIAISGAAAAQDLAVQYRQAFQGLGTTAQWGEPVGQYEAVRSMIAALDGRWFPAIQFAGNQPDLDVARIGLACDKFGSTIVPVEPMSFDMVSSRNVGEVVTRYVYVGGSAFQRLTPLHQALTRVYGPEYASKSDEHLASALRNIGDGLQGPVTLWMPSPDILVMLKPGLADIWGRCPG